MKPVFANINLKKSASVLAAAALLSFASAKASATPIIEKIISPTDKEVSVSFVGANDNTLVFYLSFENKSAQKFYLIVKDDAGQIVYQSAFTDVHFDKNIRIMSDASEVHPTFIIRTATEQIERKISVNHEVSENYVVTTL